MELGLVMLAVLLAACEFLIFRSVLSDNTELSKKHAELSKKYNDLRVENARLKSKAGE